MNSHCSTKELCRTHPCLSALGRTELGIHRAALAVPAHATAIGISSASQDDRVFVADINIDIATNEVVRGTLTLQRSGTVAWSFKA